MWPPGLQRCVEVRRRRPACAASRPSHEVDRVLTREPGHVGQPHQNLDPDCASDGDGETTQLEGGPLRLKRRQGVFEPMDRTSLPQRELRTLNRVRLEGEPKHGALLASCFDDHPRERRDDEIETYGNVVGRSLRQERLAGLLASAAEDPPGHQTPRAPAIRHGSHAVTRLRGRLIGGGVSCIWKRDGNSGGTSIPRRPR